MKKCSKCKTNEARPNQRYCRECHSEYMRDNRPSYAQMTPGQRKRDRCRSYANVYLRRGKIVRHPCEKCGNTDSEMHHEDYDLPLVITWLCRACHLALHRSPAFKK